MEFSVIIPIYNVAPYIGAGFESLLAQTFRDYEVIFVDDGSTDSGNAICSALADEYPNVSLYTQPNSGSGPARNLGMEKAVGEYLVFFDIDDALLPNALQTIHEKILEDPSRQMIMFGYRETDQDAGYSHDFRFESREYHTNADIRSDYVDRYSSIGFNNGFVWNKVYKREFIKTHGIAFEPLRVQQDEVFNMSVYPKLTRLCVIDDVLYNYFVYHSGKNASSRYLPERLDVYRRVREAFLHLYETWGLDDGRFLDYVNRRYLKGVITHINAGLLGGANPQSTKEKDEGLREIFEREDVRECLLKIPEGMKLTERCYCKLMRSRNTFGYRMLRKAGFAVLKLRFIAKRMLK